MKSRSLSLASAVVELQLPVDTSACNLNQPGLGLLLKWAVLPFSCFFATSLLVPAQVFDVAVVWPSPVKEEWWWLEKVCCGGWLRAAEECSVSWQQFDFTGLNLYQVVQGNWLHWTAVDCSVCVCIYMWQETHSSWYFSHSDLYKHQ